MVMTGMRIQIGTQAIERAPSYIEIFGRTMQLNLSRSRWFDFPFTREEALQADKKLNLFSESPAPGTACPSHLPADFGATSLWLSSILGALCSLLLSDICHPGPLSFTGGGQEAGGQERSVLKNARGKGGADSASMSHICGAGSALLVWSPWRGREEASLGCKSSMCSSSTRVLVTHH